ncbi:uncharacterized protein LOC128877044 [Hylaeus volcanicus]|uniref:uncharacterized protein LOC128877044 n=1 Tax=Hylaeus volcanicus TaxID=313075 RepID=UPI0023B8618A|nr:uncharacterized protein LOC128877044 [Hylaeus volcanicus]
MDELCEQQETKVETECGIPETENENASTNNSVADLESSEKRNVEPEEEHECHEKCQLSNVTNKNLCPLKPKETSSGTKVKRKARSTRRKLNAMVSNTSLHFSDTDSEGELTTMKPQVRSLNHAPDIPQAPIISITTDNTEAPNGLPENSTLLSPDGKDTIQCSNFVENLTDVDEIYPSETETEQKETENGLDVTENFYLDETDYEDLEDSEEVQTTIYVKPRADIFGEYSGETIITKESDGPLSVEIRNKIYHEEIPQSGSCSKTPDIVVMSQTDEEDMAISDEDDMQEICCSQREFLEDLDVLMASQIVMTNINKSEHMLLGKDTSDDGINDCHTDTEDVDQVE